MSNELSVSHSSLSQLCFDSCSSWNRLAWIFCRFLRRCSSSHCAVVTIRPSSVRHKSHSACLLLSTFLNIVIFPFSAMWSSSLFVFCNLAILNAKEEDFLTIICKDKTPIVRSVFCPLILVIYFMYIFTSYLLIFFPITASDYFCIIFSRSTFLLYKYSDLEQV